MRIITGCARSGTSFVAQVLRELGGDFGDDADLISGDEWNPGGYLESRKVNTLNHRLLFGGWSKPELWIDVMWPKDRWIRLKKLGTLTLTPFVCRPRAVRVRGVRMQDQIATVSAEFEGRMVKDPRFAFIMQPWLAHGEVDSVLYVIRHPWESAASMKRQTGLPLALTYRAWADSVRRFGPPEGVPVSYVDYNAFFDDKSLGAQMRALFDFADREFDEALADQIISKVLDPKLRSRVAEGISLPRSIAELYEELLGRVTSVGG